VALCYVVEVRYAQLPKIARMEVYIGTKEKNEKANRSIAASSYPALSRALLTTVQLRNTPMKNNIHNPFLISRRSIKSTNLLVLILSNEALGVEAFV